METKTAFDQWCILELFGHTRVAGRVSEAQIGGGAFIRVDVPDGEDSIAWTRFYGPNAIYSISPISEELARQMAQRIAQPPIMRWEVAQLEPHTQPNEENEDDQDE